ncbi:amidohydrolase family protein [Burkholderia pseudomultivorans]|uniref:amidohydrolase family protein n=1 Tax=Burkholderia pseudomultivorans TaxID=1207504 RepID=UPI00188F2B63|nr:amidohydrolase family protein [Burkholderia pseudomultivorans]MBF5010892.1 amidohydrolase family protein [Burkholderia pseudomultivorans]
MPEYFPFDPEPRTPSKAPPPLACDSQFHVFGPAERYPVLPGAAYEMPSATIERALHLHSVLGFTRGVIVQATTYGADHQIVLDGLAAAGPNYRGCANAVVLKERDDAYIARLHDAGVRGARFSRAGLGPSMDEKDIERALARVNELGWYVKVQPEPGGIASTIAPFRKLNVPVVIDHMGRPNPEAGDADPSLKVVLEMLSEGNTWTMLSLGEKITKTGRPWDDVLPIAHKLVEAAPHRCIYGTDWPHPVSPKQPPNDADLLELLYRYVPDDATLKRVLVDNPAELFGF